MKSKSYRLTDEQLIDYLVNNYESKYKEKYTSFNAFLTYLIRLGICSLDNVNLYKDDTFDLLNQIIDALKTVNETNLKIHEEDRTLKYTLFNLLLNMSQGKFISEEEINNGLLSSKPEFLDKEKRHY